MSHEAGKPRSLIEGAAKRGVHGATPLVGMLAIFAGSRRLCAWQVFGVFFQHVAPLQSYEAAAETRKPSPSSKTYLFLQPRVGRYYGL